MRWDVAVAGAGVFGLSAALAARRRGLSVVVLEAAHVGAGASGGIVGALSPHVPEPWTPMKAFQLDALRAAPDWWAGVEAASGRPTGFVASGRLMPLADPQARARAEARTAEAAAHWGDGALWRVVPGDAAPGWLDADAAPFGAVREGVSARLFPRAACAALAGALSAAGGEIREGVAVRGWQPGRVDTDAGPVAARRLVLAAGVAGFDLAAPALGHHVGAAVKGQAALMDARAAPRAPVLYDRGTYVVPQPGGVAVGSTSETQFTDTAPDARLDAVIDAARALCPALRGARVVERWAGLRPRARGRVPMLGPLGAAPEVIAALGGFKVGFGLAPAVGAAVADMLEGRDPGLPAAFAPAAHLPKG